VRLIKSLKRLKNEKLKKITRKIKGVNINEIF